MRRAGLLLALAQAPTLAFQATRPFSPQPLLNRRHAVPGADIEQPPVEDDTSRPSPSAASAATSSIPASPSRGKWKVNEIDFCIAPADASLSRAYGASGVKPAGDDSSSALPLLSLTRALNNASNRAVRRILLARSWPSAEALNLSLRQVAAAEREAALLIQEAAEQSTASGESDQSQDTPAVDGPKCPVPRPILNVLTRKRAGVKEGGQPVPRSRTDEEYVADQLKSFKERYGALPGYNYAEAYLDAILSLATSGIESTRAEEVLQSGIYDDAYRRIRAVLRTVGVLFVIDETTGRRVMSKKLIDQDICLSMIDKISIKNEAGVPQPAESKQAKLENAEIPADTESKDDADTDPTGNNPNVDVEDGVEIYRPKLKFWKKENQPVLTDSESESDKEGPDSVDGLSKDDLGAVLLSAEEPTMTRQLNALSNIVLRALLFGGDQELLVLSETLVADRSAFVERWYAAAGKAVDVEATESRPGLQFYDCLIALLRKCYTDGVITDLQPPNPLTQSYANAYERLVATSVELGSGYLKPDIADVMDMPTPRTATEELGRFAVWETAFRQQAAPDATAYPEDLQGKWEVRDEIGGETIGTSTVRLGENGEVDLAEPLEGLRWRCDPGPTHLDTCTFQVLSSDGTILQYRGFVDRGARLEARVSKRPIKIRGCVNFQMRDGSIDYFKDMLPINYRQGTTRFIMTKLGEEGE